MGSACCIAAKDQRVPKKNVPETMQRSIVYSPSWSFRWDNRRRVAGETENIPCQFSHGIDEYSFTQVKKPNRSVSCNISESSDQVENFGQPTFQCFPAHEGADANGMSPSSDICTTSNSSTEVKITADSLRNAESLTPRISSSTSIPSSLPTPTADIVSPQSHLRSHSNSASDSRIFKMESPSRIIYSASNGRTSSFAFSTGSHDFSDSWSIQTFSELTASSQRQRWSFESELSSVRLSCSSSSDLQTCDACRKLLKERISESDLYSIVAVLVCGHFFHAECLERMTKEVDKYDPTCPVCTSGEKKAFEMSRKASRAELRRLKTYNNRIMDSCSGSELDFADHIEERVSKLGTSSSSKKPFLARHFSLGAKWGRSLSNNGSTRNKSFWNRYRKK